MIVIGKMGGREKRKISRPFVILKISLVFIYTKIQVILFGSVFVWNLGVDLKVKYSNCSLDNRFCISSVLRF